MYDSYLTKEQKTTIANQGHALVNWDRTNENGTILVTALEGKKTYNFVEIKDWKELFSIKKNGFKKVYMKRKTHYDSYGNILNRTTLEQKKGEHEYYEKEEWSHYYQVADEDTVGLIQQITTFFEDGQIRSKQKVYVDNFRQLLSDRLKTKYYIDTVSQYNNNNELIRQDVYSLSDKKSAE